MSASYVVDLGNTTVSAPSIVNVNAFPCSGAVVGNPVDLLLANTMTNLSVVGGLSQSGALRVRVQTSDATTSGTFTDPTSGLAQLPTSFSSGGILFINSGGAGLRSGFQTFAGFQRPHRYARAIALSGDFWQAPLSVGFIGQAKTTFPGSGGGFTYSPGSGTVDV